MMKKLLVALHDVTPAHAARLEKAERFFEDLAVPRVTYFLVPRFHGQAAAHASPEFVGWCREIRPFEVQWFLHGYFHDEMSAPAKASGSVSLAAWLGSAVVTAHEAEFLRLRGQALRARLQAGMLSFDCCIGAAPSGFVAPGWLFNNELVAALTGLQFQFTESQFRVLHLPTGRELRCPVITWATRTPAHLYGSLAAAAMRRRLARDTRVVRVALHPHDFDHERTIASIARTLDALRRDRVIAAYDASLFE